MRFLQYPFDLLLAMRRLLYDPDAVILDFYLHRLTKCVLLPISSFVDALSLAIATFLVLVLECGCLILFIPVGPELRTGFLVSGNDLMIPQTSNLAFLQASRQLHDVFVSNDALSQTFDLL